MTTQDRADLAKLWAKIGRLLQEPVTDVQPEPEPEPEPEAVEVSEPEPDTQPEPADVTPIKADSTVTVDHAADDTRYASRRQRGLIAGLTGTEYNPSGGLRREMAKAIITNLLELRTVIVPTLELVLVPNPSEVEAFKSRTEAA